MAKQKTTGKCCFCGKDFGKIAMVRHVQSCKTRMQKAEKLEVAKNQTFIVRAQDRYDRSYWLLLEVSADSTLDSLDAFLREIWLECCGHISCFRIGGTMYNSHPFDEMDDESMDIALDKVLWEGMKFDYIYDFGSSTELVLQVISQQQDSKLSEPVTLLGRNNPPSIDCGSCGKPAREICIECLYSDNDAFFCDKCVKSHECEMFLPVVNSPRMGVCGYGG